jgi:hypothetical protein
MRTRKSFDALQEHIKNKLGDEEFAPTHRFLQELAAEVDEWEEEFLARIIHDSTSFFISTRCTRAIYLS